MPREKIYVPRSSAKARQTQYGEFLSLGFNVEELIKFAQAHKNERGYLNLTVSKRKQPSDRGETHSVFLDDYVPGDRREAPAVPAQDAADTGQDVPF